jgi:hypothetical protein
MKFLVVLLFAACAPAESLHYNINWPSGLSLGEATLTSEHGREQWSFDLNIDASVPGFAVRDHDRATASLELCGIQFDKSAVHGKRKSEEHITFDQDKRTVKRGNSELSVSSCARDAFTFLQFARKELSEGRLPPQQQVVFGALYNVRLEYTGAQTIAAGAQQTSADRIVATIKGPAADLTVEMFFARDPARTPLLAKVPVSIGTLTVELVR